MILQIRLLLGRLKFHISSMRLRHLKLLRIYRRLDFSFFDWVYFKMSKFHCFDVNNLSDIECKILALKARSLKSSVILKDSYGMKFRFSNEEGLISDYLDYVDRLRLNKYLLIIKGD